MSNIVQLVKEFHAAQAELQAKLKADGEAQLKIVFKEIFDNHPGLKAFAYVGYTMGFNDGEACYHSGYSYVGNFHLQEYWKKDGTQYWSADCYEECGWSELEDHFLNEYADLEDTTNPLDFVNKDCLTIEQASADVEEVSDVIEMVYDTDYLIKVSLNDAGEVVTGIGEYDCGY